MKQAPCAWNDKIDAFFQDTGFSHTTADPQLYIHKVDGLVMAIVIYVDDLIILGMIKGLFLPPNRNYMLSLI